MATIREREVGVLEVAREGPSGLFPLLTFPHHRNRNVAGAFLEGC